MKVKIFFIALFMSLFSVFSCAADLMQNNNGQILQAVVVLDNNEVAAANLALKKSTDANVRKFAQMMIRDHGKNIRDAKALAHKIKVTLTASDKSTDLQKQGKDELNQLVSLTGKDFDKKYIDAMVQGHQDALNLIDDTLLPNTSDGTVTAFLKATRAVVAQHLQMAKDTQKMLS